MNVELAQKIWELYQKGVDHHNKMALYSKTTQAYDFYEDRQWVGVEAGGETLPFYNFIKPVVKYKTASIAMNEMAIVYTPLESDDVFQQACETLNRYAEKQWEKLKMATLAWDLVKAGNIAGDSYIYFYDGGNKAQIIDNTNIYLGDEQLADIQKQPYILISERLRVEDVKKIAKANGIDPDEVTSDEQEHQTNRPIEVKDDNGKCTSILKLWKEDDVVHFCRATKNVVYEPDTPIDGLSYYPVASFIVEQLHNSARGNGEVRPLIPNQIEVNKTLYRRSSAVKTAAFPQVVYDTERIDNPEMIGEAGTALEVHGSVSAVKDMIAYLQPNGISNDAKVLGDEMLQTTKDLAGAGDAALGQINPEQASGNAIIAVRDQAAIPLNESISNYKQCIEDIANIWYSMWVAYNVNGMQVTITDKNGQEQQAVIDAETLKELQVNVRVDVSQANPYSRYAQEKSLENLFMNQQLSFEEYINALDDSSSVPKNKMLAVIEKRKQQQENELMMQNQQLQAQNQQLNEYVNQVAQQLGYQDQGGQQNVMQQMPV